MKLQSLLKDNRNKWQEKTKEDILKELLCRSHQYKISGQKDEKLVMVFGKSHAGKTTLILSLMGVKDDKLKELNYILRAGVPEGSSSTSTAIIYQRSNDEMFGICERGINEINDNKIKKYNLPDFITNLAQIRDDVETGKRSSEKILYLYLPYTFFGSVNDDKPIVNILDVPGYETRNEKERYHTDALLNKYMAISSLNIVIRSFYDINDLQYFCAPNRDDVTKLSSGKYIVITTRSYSQENIFNYFLIPKADRKESFAQMIEKECEVQFERICGKNIPRFFPVDIGESFDELINTKIKDEEDREYLIQYRDDVFKKIYEYIYSKQSNTLLSWVQELLEDEEFYRDKELKKLSEQKHSLEIFISRRKENKNKREQFLCEIKNNNKIIICEINELQRKRKELIIPDINSIIEEKTKEIIEENFEGNFAWKNKKIVNNVSDLFAQAFSDMIQNYLKTLEIENPFLYEDLKKTSPFLEIDNYETLLHTSLDDKINRHKILKVLNPPNKEKIEIGKKELQKSMDRCIRDLFIEWCQLYDSQIEKKRTRELKNYAVLLFEEEKKIQDLERELNKLNLELKSVNEKIEIVNNRVKKDKETIKKYREVAQINYKNQHDKIIRLMNKEKTAEGKLAYILLLGLMKKDYEKVVMS